ncbi:tetratricopeptide repeat protein [Spirosoma gilvum]
MDLLLVTLVIGLIIYVRYLAGLQTNAEKDIERFQPGIDEYNMGNLDEAFHFFHEAIQQSPSSSIAYLYRARCFKALGDYSAAMTDLEAGKRYDDTLPDLHLESGRIHFQRQEFTDAFSDFDKAVFYSHGSGSTAYYWRGLTRQRLNQPQEAEQDWAKAATLTLQATQHSTGIDMSTPFLSWQLAGRALLTLVNSSVLLYAITHSPTIHGPYLLAAVSAGIIGYVEPKKGWLLALIQALLIVLGYRLITTEHGTNARQELEQFTLYGSIALTFIGSFISGFLKRKLNSSQV